MKTKPSSCGGCPLHSVGEGFAPPEGEPRLGVALLGEALGEKEALASRPFVGPAGFRLERMIQRAGYQRADFQILNAVSCRPPQNRQPFPEEISKCRQYWEPEAEKDRTKVIVPMGNTGLATTLGLDGILSKRGYVWRSEELDAFILPTVHPAYIMRGNSNWEAAFIYDLRHAVEIARDGWTPVERDYTLDPVPAGAWDWAFQYERELLVNPKCALSADIETPDKSDSEDQTDINLGYLAGTIYRIGFAYVDRFGKTKVLSVPWDANYLPIIKRLLKIARELIFCPEENQRVLTADLRWVRAGDLKVGDTLLSFDEQDQHRTGARRFKTGAVYGVEPVETEVWCVKFSDGSSVVVTPDHKWLAKRKGKWGDSWHTTRELKPGMTATKFAEPWVHDTSHEAGYLAGVYDGEGSLSKQHAGSVNVSFSQNPGLVKSVVKELLIEKGFQVSDYPQRKSNVGSLGLRGGLGQKLRFLGSIRPVRLLKKFTPELCGSTRIKAPRPEVVSIEPVGRKRVVQIGVDAGTFILEGFGAHNCYRHFDVPRIRAHNITIVGEVLDVQEAWHVLHSDLPKSLEHITPYLCPRQPAWKHLSGSQPAYYNAVDAGVQIEGWWRLNALLREAGMWELYQRDVRALNPILVYMGTMGMPIDPVKRLESSELLMRLKEENRVKLNSAAEGARPQKIYKRKPKKDGTYIEVPLEGSESFCTECGKRASKSHPHFKCGTAPGEVPLGTLATRVVALCGWAQSLDFKPSNQGLIRYAQFRGYKLLSRWDKVEGKRVTSMDEHSVRKYALKYTEDPVWPLVLDERELTKLLGTYVGRVTTEPERMKSPEQIYHEARLKATYGKMENGEFRKGNSFNPFGDKYGTIDLSDDDIPF